MNVKDIMVLMFVMASMAVAIAGTIGIAHETRFLDAESDAGLGDCDCRCVSAVETARPARPARPIRPVAPTLDEVAPSSLTVCRDVCLRTMNEGVDLLDKVYGTHVSDKRSAALQPIFAAEDKCWAACGDGGRTGETEVEKNQ
jgi:hypothetical protein